MSMLMVFIIFSGCGSSGGGGGSSPPAETQVSFTPPTALDAETTYYWQVKAEDGKHGFSKSEINSFTTLP